MKHAKNEVYPYGMSENEANLLMTSEDVYDVLETFDSLEDSLEFIKEVYGLNAYEYAKKDSEQNISEEIGFIEYKINNGDTNYIGYASFDISDNIENYRNKRRNEPSFFWFSTGRVVRVETY